MKKLIIAALLVCATAFGAQQTINVGGSANDGTGDTLRGAFIKVNDNFTELYGLTVDITAALDFSDSGSITNGLAADFATYYIGSSNLVTVISEAAAGGGADHTSAIDFSATGEIQNAKKIEVDPDPLGGYANGYYIGASVLGAYWGVAGGAHSQGVGPVAPFWAMSYWGDTTDYRGVEIHEDSSTVASIKAAAYTGNYDLLLGATGTGIVNVATSLKVNTNVYVASRVGVGTESPSTQVHILNTSAASGIHTNGLRLQNDVSGNSWIMTSGIVGDDNQFGLKSVALNAYLLRLATDGDLQISGDLYFGASASNLVDAIADGDAGSAATAASALSAHESDTTSVHGIADTDTLVRGSGSPEQYSIPMYSSTNPNQIEPTGLLITNGTNLILGELQVPAIYLASGESNRVVVTDVNTNTATAPAPWTSVTLDGTNAVIDLLSAVPGVDKNFYYTLSTSNYFQFSNIVQGAQGTIWINAAGTPQEINFSGSYDNFSTNEIAPVFTVTNRAIIAYKVGWGTDATNIMIGIKRK